MRTALVALAIAAIASPLSAVDFGVVPTIGTNGVGVGVDLRFSPVVGARLLAHTGTYSRNLHEEDIRYTGNLKLNNFGALIDLYPGSGSFRISGGLFSNNNHIDLRSSDDNVITVNGVNYPSLLIGYITGDVTFNRTSPYLGIGWGVSPGRHWGLTLDAGAMFQGSPKIAVQPHPLIPAIVPASFYTNLENERVKTENDIRGYRYWPIVSAGVVFRF